MTTEQQIVAMANLRLWAQGFSIAGGVTAVAAGMLAYYAMSRGNELTAIDKQEKAEAAAKKDALAETQKAALQAEVVDLKGQLIDATFQRHLTIDQDAKLLSDLAALLEAYQGELAKHPGALPIPPTIYVKYEDDEETRLYAKQISGVIAQAGWEVNGPGKKDNLPAKLADFEVTYPGGDFTKPMTDRLKTALEHAGLRVALRKNQYAYDHSLDILVRRRDGRGHPTPPVDPHAPLTIFSARD